MREDEQAGMLSTGFYRLDKNGQAALMISKLCVSNGLVWSPDKDRMYFSDSASGKVYRSAIPAGDFVPSEADVLVAIQNGAPDGAVTDVAGRYWSAMWGAACIRCYLPDAKLLQEFALPAPQPTCVAFGGFEDNLMFVASARAGLDSRQLSAHPKSGSLFIFSTDTCGSRNFRYISKGG